MMTTDGFEKIMDGDLHGEAFQYKSVYSTQRRCTTQRYAAQKTANPANSRGSQSTHIPFSVAITTMVSRTAFNLTTFWCNNPHSG